MRVWIVNHYAVPPTEPGGIRHYGLAAALIRRGDEAVVIASSFHHDTRRDDVRFDPGENAKQEFIGSVPFLWLRTPAYGGRAKRLWNMVVFAKRVLTRSATRDLARPDIVVGSTVTLFAAFAALRLARRLRVPFVLEVRDVWPQTLIDFGVSRFHPLILLFGWMERYLYRHADAIVTLLPGAVEHMRARGARHQPILWLPNGVDLSIIPPPRPQEQGAPFQVVYTGAHSNADSLDILLRAASILKSRKRSDISFLLIGSGTSKTELMRIASEQQLENVQFRPPVPRKELYQIFNSAGALAATLKAAGVYRFGMSLNKIYDYMGAARPIIFAGRALNDPVSDSGCGFTVEPEDSEALADAIEHLAAMSPEERYQMGLRGRRYVEQNHDFAILARKLEDFLIETIERTGRNVSRTDVPLPEREHAAHV